MLAAAYGPVPAEDGAPFSDLDPIVPQLPGLDIAQVKRSACCFSASLGTVPFSVTTASIQVPAGIRIQRSLVALSVQSGYCGENGKLSG
jgi:hypothetical protein